jgi:peroxiredoxin Q/BCP
MNPGRSGRATRGPSDGVRLVGPSAKVGDPAPDFELIPGEGRTVHLSDYRGRSEVVLSSYPTDDSPTCTAEPCSFRDSYEHSLGAGAEAICVGVDPQEGQWAFAGRYRLPFPLAARPHRDIRCSAWGSAVV